MGHPNEVHEPGTALAPVSAGSGAVVVAKEAGSVALSAQVEAKVKAGVLLARQFPRSWADVQQRLLSNFERPILAENALYSKPVGDKKVQGLSIRFAEEALRAMGNISVTTMLVSDDEDKRVYIVEGMDLETLASVNVTATVTKQVERSSVKADSIVLGKRTNSQGKPTYILKATSEDDYRAKEQAILQKARRDVILFLVPGDIQEMCEQKIRSTIADRDKKDPQAAILRCTEAFYSFGISVAEVEKLLGHPMATTTTAELQLLRTFLTAIKEGEATWAQIVEMHLGVNTGAESGKAAPATATGKLRDRVAGGAKKAESAKAEGEAVNTRTAEETESGTAAAKLEKTTKYIRGLVARKRAGEELTDSELSEIQFFSEDNPGVEL